MFFAGAHRHHVDRLGQQRVETERQGFDLYAAGLDLGDVEQVVDQHQQAFTGRTERFDVFLLVGGQGLTARQQGRQADNGVHRRADFVAHGRQELALGDVGGIGALGALLQCPGLRGPVFQQIADAVLALAIAQGGADGAHEVAKLHRPLDQRHVADLVEAVENAQRILAGRRQQDDGDVRPFFLPLQGVAKTLAVIRHDGFLGDD